MSLSSPLQPKRHTLAQWVYQKYKTWSINTKRPKPNSLKKQIKWDINLHKSKTYTTTNLKLFDKVIHEDQVIESLWKCFTKHCKRFGSSKTRTNRQTLEIGQGRATYYRLKQLSSRGNTSNCDLWPKSTFFEDSRFAYYYARTNGHVRLHIDFMVHNIVGMNLAKKIVRISIKIKLRPW